MINVISVLVTNAIWNYTIKYNILKYVEYGGVETPLCPWTSPAAPCPYTCQVPCLWISATPWIRIKLAFEPGLRLEVCDKLWMDGPEYHLGPLHSCSHSYHFWGILPTDSTCVGLVNVALHLLCDCLDTFLLPWGGQLLSVILSSFEEKWWKL